MKILCGVITFGVGGICGIVAFCVGADWAMSVLKYIGWWNQ